MYSWLHARDVKASDLVTQSDWAIDMEGEGKVEFKTILHCEEGDFELLTDGMVSIYNKDGLVYIQNEQYEEIFVVNEMRLIAIDLNNAIE
jgi:hypothetical protein